MKFLKNLFGNFNLDINSLVDDVVTTDAERKELKIKETELMHKINMDKAKLELEKLKSDTNRDLQEERIKSENKREGARLSVDMAKESNKAKKAGVDAIINLAKNTGS